MTDRTHTRVVSGRTWLVVGAIFLACASATRAQAFRGAATPTVLVRGLSEPTGIALHPESGEIYVAEAGAGRISVIRNGSAVPVITAGWAMDENYPRWAVRPNTPETYWMNTSLQSPISLAVNTNGNIFVLEGGDKGRLIEFILNEGGTYRTARVHPIAWLAKNFAWRNVRIAPSGKLFINGNVAGNRHLHFGSVLMRDLKGDWWVIDYGPFIHFSGIDLSRDGDILLVGERKLGGFAWWDIEHHVPLGEIQESIEPGSIAGSVAMLPDGAFAVVQQSETAGNALMRVDPFSGRSVLLLAGVQDIGGIIADRTPNGILLTDRAAGTLYRCEIPAELVAERYLVEQSREVRETREGYTPRETPTFLRDFLLSSGMLTTRDDVAEKDEEAPDQAQIDWREMSFSLKEFARYIPLIAGSMNLSPKSEIADPIEVIEFVIFFPGSVIVQGKDASPSMTFFASRRRSGKQEVTRQLFSGFALSRAGKVDEQDWIKASDTASMSIPLATVNMRRDTLGRYIDMVFLGLGIYHDYYVNLFVGLENKGDVIVEDADGKQEWYEASFVRVDEQGRVFRNLVIAGFDPEEDKVDTIGWLNIGYSPVGTALSTGDRLKRFASTEDSLRQLIDGRTEEARQRLESELRDEEL